MEELNDKFYYVYSSSISNRIQIKIGTLEGKRQKPEYDTLLSDPILKYSGLCEDGCSDLMVVCQIYDQNQPLALPVSTSYKAFTSRWSWNEWLTLPVQFNDLPRTAQLALTIYDCVGPNKLWPVGGTTISLFSKHGLFRQGMVDLRVFPNREADGNYPTQTPGKAKDQGKEQMQRLTKLTKKHRNGHMTKVDWLDRLTFRELGLINNEEKSCSEYMYLMIEFPTVYIDLIPHYVVYFEQNGEDIHSFRAQSDIVTVPDQEILKENLVERKHHKLARSLRSGHCDKDAKPNAAIRDILNTIVSYPSIKPLTNEEQDHVWKFRFYLSTQKKALTKFLKCVNWTQQNEVRQALSMMRIWAPMDVEDALELLSPNFTHPAVRKYAISRLQQAPDEEILLYLLQLVQALKYEDFKDIQEGYSRISPGREAIMVHEEKEAQLEKKDSKESNSTITNESVMHRSSSYNQADQLASSNVNSVIEVDADQRAASLPENILHNLNVYTDSANTDTLQDHMNEEEEVQDLATFLIQRACKNAKLANYFYWYLLIECEDPEPTMKQNMVIRELYLTVMKTFSQTLAKGNAEMQRKRTNLSLQQKFIDNLVKLVKTVLREGGNRKKKAEKLQQLLADPTVFKFNFGNFEPIPFPLDPDVTIKGIIAEKASLFKSALMPSKLHFITSDNSEYVAIFKHGDDLRQDQLILQMITLMDKLLRKENLDLKLTPYKVLATSTKHGFVQYIDSVSVAEAVNAEGSIHNYFRKYHPQENGPYGIAPEIMDSYVRSCAGYCVITYLLGVGDRHLDNLLVTTCGKLFHIDFGFILGRDPKPLPPPMKLSKEMVEAMGGGNSEHYQEFRKQCYTAFLHLRRHANLMLNLFSLMIDTSVPDIALEPDKAVKKVQEKFRLDLGEEEAVHYIQNLIDASASAVMPAIVEQFHKITQYIRK
ncbi:phosphatidylinositol 3-kinase catalytic subunit type 3 [Tribolium castaneum]|uniref:Phosphatidylinositol 3-kinase catalytic subunit type 3 n=1 Tax=Tribolium castaneum TaxID=7070 RepID=D6W9A3_TRICA|nr:PREDICTED: phosphatidylinositol 3-kinase catalytic subunit type 3 [Tribolium castaneum]EEZ98191.1 Phosphatidylinositol 3-kinase catalytic subunit type 3-like Protein [Tribolium castaneum]|eukprot:XP_968035.2 PREDICTED: phosphatidylinositol 3-kinase catalytic subunit type 3 [Tribolium castaneum]